MLWNRPPDLTPRQHFSKHDTCNLTAANARLAELRFRERDALVTPPEQLSSWRRFNQRRAPVTGEILSDPDRSRSALGRLACRCGDGFERGRTKPSKPGPLSDRSLRGSRCSVELTGAASAIESLRGCRFPIGDAYSEYFHFCNEVRLGVGPYCARHAKICFCGVGRRL